MTAQAYIEKLLDKEERVLIEYNTLMNLCLDAVKRNAIEDLEYYMEGEPPLREILTNVTNTRKAFSRDFPKEGEHAENLFPCLDKQRVQMKVSLQEVISGLKKSMERIRYDLESVNIPKSIAGTVQRGPSLIDIEA